jgi:hypothetical protein
VAQIAALPSLTAGRRCVLDGSRLEELDTCGRVHAVQPPLRAGGLPPERLSRRAMDARHERLLALVQERMAAPAVGVAPSRHLGRAAAAGPATVRSGAR